MTKMIKFNFNEGNYDLEKIPNLLREKLELKEGESREIERKYLIKKEITKDLLNNDDFYLSEYIIVEQSYLSIDPEIRIMKKFYPNIDKAKYYLTYKSDGKMSREELECQIFDNDYVFLKNKLTKTSSIYKEVAIFSKYDEVMGLDYEISNVNFGDIYIMEIEFASEIEAKAFKIPEIINEYIIKEVTYDDDFKMKNYWNRKY